MLKQKEINHLETQEKHKWGADRDDRCRITGLFYVEKVDALPLTVLSLDGGFWKFVERERKKRKMSDYVSI